MNLALQSLPVVPVDLAFISERLDIDLYLETGYLSPLDEMLLADYSSVIRILLKLDEGETEWVLGFLISAKLEECDGAEPAEILSEDV